MRILFLSQGYTIGDHPGWHDALIKLKKEGLLSYFMNIPYLGFVREKGWNSFYNEVVNLCEQYSFDIVYFHYFHKKGKPSPAKCIYKLRNLNKPPIIVTSGGDPFSDNWMKPDYPNDFKIISSMADITFSTQMGHAAKKMINWGARNIVFSPNGMCQVRFRANSINIDNHHFDFDVVFVGNKNESNIFNPLSRHWWFAKIRKQLVKKLYQKYGNNFGLFGHGWDYPCAQGPIAFNQQQKTFRRGRIIVGGNPYSYSDYYSSNRLFFEISSGIPTIELLVPRLDKIIRNNDHCYFVNDIDEVIDRCESLLKSDKQILYYKAANAAKYIEEKHTQYHRMKFKIRTILNYINKKPLNFPYFLPEVNINIERKFAHYYKR